jgi:hypothetical protein
MPIFAKHKSRPTRNFLSTAMTHYSLLWDADHAARFYTFVSRASHATVKAAATPKDPKDDIIHSKSTDEELFRANYSRNNDGHVITDPAAAAAAAAADATTRHSRNTLFQWITRKKYDADLPKSQVCVATAYTCVRDADDFVNVIRRHEVRLGLYYHFDRKTGSNYIIKNGAMGTYVSPNPVNSCAAVRHVVDEYHKVVADTAHAAIDGRTTAVVNLGTTLTHFCNALDSKFFGKQMASVDYAFLHLDIDMLGDDALVLVIDFLRTHGVSCEHVLLAQTKNGFHLLVNVTECGKELIGHAHRMCAAQMKLGNDVSVCPRGSPMPVPGTLLAGFRVRIVDLDFDANPATAVYARRIAACCGASADDNLPQCVADICVKYAALDRICAGCWHTHDGTIVEFDEDEGRMRRMRAWYTTNTYVDGNADQPHLRRDADNATYRAFYAAIECGNVSVARRTWTSFSETEQRDFRRLPLGANGGYGGVTSIDYVAQIALRTAIRADNVKMVHFIGACANIPLPCRYPMLATSNEMLACLWKINSLGQTFEEFCGCVAYTRASEEAESHAPVPASDGHEGCPCGWDRWDDDE